jgi:hypothetical protein
LEKGVKGKAALVGKATSERPGILEGLKKKCKEAKAGINSGK